MNTSNVDSKPKIRKETKNKIKVDFERTSFKERFKAKFLTLTFLKKVVWIIVRYILLIGVAYIVLFPFFSKISSSLMAPSDFNDSMVRLIPKNFSIDIYKAIFTEQEYMKAFGNTLLLSLSTALIQTFICSFVAYGFAKFKFKGNKILFALVILTMIIPHRTLQLAITNMFANFDILGIFGFLSGGGISIFGFEYNNEFLSSINILGNIDSNVFTPDGVRLVNTFWPYIILSITGLAFKNGLYIFLLRQFFMGVPDELEESAYIDGSGVFKTFFTIILPISIPMMITVFLFSFSWCWTDIYYSKVFFTGNNAPLLLTSEIGKDIPSSIKDLGGSTPTKWHTAIRTTGGLMIIAPLVVIYLFCQKYLVQGIERSGLTAD